MLWRNTTNRYGVITKTFHWVLFLLVAGMLAVGLYMDGLPLSPEKIELYGWHKSFGVLVLGLVVLRLLWRFITITPLLPGRLGYVERIAAHGMHYLLYFMLFLMPITGWFMSAAANFPVSFFGLFTLPMIIEPNQASQNLFNKAHEIGGILLIVFIVLHAAAALLHHFYYKDNILKRMLPFVDIKDH